MLFGVPIISTAKGGASMTKRIVAALLCVMLLLSSAYADFDGDISAHSAILYCCDTGDVLFEKNADEEMLIASITKIMTAIVVFESCDLDAVIQPKPEWCAVEGSSMYLDYNKTYTVRDILKGMLIVSGNDAATTLACWLSGDERSFAARMNAKAKELGLEHSSFRNPHGLDDEEHYSSARDMARLAAYCMENEEFKDIVSCYSATVDINTYYNHNKLLLSYEGCIGVKTGYTIAAGRTLISCAERNGMRLICVTLNADDDWNDHRKLLDYGFQNFAITSYTPESFRLSLPVYSATTDRAFAELGKDVKLLSKKDAEVNVKLELPRILFAGGLAGEKIGVMRIYVDGELASEEDLYYTENVPVNTAQRLTLYERLLRLYSIGAKPLYIPG